MSKGFRYPLPRPLETSLPQSYLELPRVAHSGRYSRGGHRDVTPFFFRLRGFLSLNGTGGTTPRPQRPRCFARDQVEWVFVESTEGLRSQRSRHGILWVVQGAYHSESFYTSGSGLDPLLTPRNGPTSGHFTYDCPR